MECLKINGRCSFNDTVSDTDFRNVTLSDFSSDIHSQRANTSMHVTVKLYYIVVKLLNNASWCVTYRLGLLVWRRDNDRATTQLHANRSILFVKLSMIII